MKFFFHSLGNFFKTKTFFRDKASRGHASLRMAGEALFVKQTAPDRCMKQHPYDSLLRTVMVTVTVDYGNRFTLPFHQRYGEAARRHQHHAVVFAHVFFRGGQGFFHRIHSPVKEHIFRHLTV